MKTQEDYYELEKYNPDDYPIVAATIGHLDMQSGLERKDGWELNQFIWVTEGEGVFKVQNKTFRLRKGQGLFTKKGIPHGYAPSGDSFSTSWVTFLNGDTIMKLYNFDDWFVFDVPDFLESSRKQLFLVCNTTKTLTLRSAHGYMWITELMDAISTHEISFSERIYHFLEKNCSKPITLKEIAEEIGTDKFTLCKHYRRETGETVMDTLKSIRIRHAKRMLSYGIESISEIGKQCGYEDVSYFIKIFREKTGITPLKYRQNK